MHYELFLPFPPTINNYYVKTRNGQFISMKGKKFRAEAEAEVREQFPFSALDGSLLVEVILHMPDKRRRDLDNYMKPLLDALTLAGVWEDDSQIDQLAIYRGTNTFGGSVRMRIHDAAPKLPPDYWP